MAGLMESLRTLVGRGTRYENVVYVGPTVSEVLGMSTEDLFRTQPHLRTVITFLARNTAQLGLHTFQRLSDTDRKRVHDDPLAQLLRSPNGVHTQYELVYSLISDLKLYDVAIWLLLPDKDRPAGWSLWPIPPSWVNSTYGGSAWAPAGLEIIRPGSGRRSYLENKPDKPPQFIMFHGYNPANPSGWISPVESLRQILAEQIQAWSYREQVWQRGGRVGTYITRPAGAPAWSPEARTKFQRDWAAKWTGMHGPKAGGTPLFEDGMELKHTRFNAREEEWVDVAKLSLATVAGVYHVNPAMVGLMETATFASMKEFARMLYTDTLGPDLRMVRDRINTFLAPVVGSSPNLYTEFNVQEKMQGSFEEQAAVLSASVGAPWMLRDEARARLNLPELPDGQGQQLITPLNVLEGGLASPRDTAPEPGAAGFTPSAAKMLQELSTFLEKDQMENVLRALGGSKGGGVQLSREDADQPLSVKAAARDEDVRMAQQVLGRFFKRQRAAVLSRLGAKADDDWWDQDRWDQELADDLYRLAMQVTQELGADTLDQLGVDPDQYDPARTVEFLRAVAASRAGAINATTRDQIEAALAGDVGDQAERSTPEGVFDQAETSRLDVAATTLATTLAAFAVMEAAKQLNRRGTTKTWRVNSRNPRASHSRMNGETVDVAEVFSNGAMWPGDAILGADEVAGCMCSVEVSIP